MNNLRKILATGLGTGYLPVAPGTWASGAACLVFLAVIAGCSGNALRVAVAMVALAGFWSVICVALGEWSEAAFGGKDPSRCTADEWAGQALALVALPLGAGWAGWLTAAGAAFIAFRLFDIIKPPPARRLEKLHAGWGILLDDLVAGLYANVAAQLVLRLALAH